MSVFLLFTVSYRIITTITFSRLFTFSPSNMAMRARCYKWPFFDDKWRLSRYYYSTENGKMQREH